ncbi:MAG: hypothetical protein E7249_20930 [Paenibacillaceae bacterium]|nr:hypothetical protein [Paenibacillaceae bacterium]
MPKTGIEKAGKSERRGRGLKKKLFLPLLLLLLSEGVIKISCMYKRVKINCPLGEEFAFSILKFA